MSLSTRAAAAAAAAENGIGPCAESATRVGSGLVRGTEGEAPGARAGPSVGAPVDAPAGACAGAFAGAFAAVVARARRGAPTGGPKKESLADPRREAGLRARPDVRGVPAGVEAAAERLLELAAGVGALTEAGGGGGGGGGGGSTNGATHVELSCGS